jgi:hypothetical protein
MKLKRLIAAFFILALNFAIIGRAYSEPIIFAQVNNPTGIVVDSTGSVFVQSQPLPEFGGGGLLKFDANGNLMTQNNQLTGNFRLALDSASNIIWAQEMNGILYSVDPDTLLAQPVIDLRTWIMGNILQSQAFNILTGMPDTLVMVNPVFGDIATWQSGAGQLDVLVTGLTNTSGGMPFVLRLSLNNGTLQNPQIVVTSLPSAVVLPPPLDTFPSGLAINSNGTVLAPLPTELDSNSAAQATQLFLSIFVARSFLLPPMPQPRTLFQRMEAGRSLLAAWRHPIPTTASLPRPLPMVLAVAPGLLYCISLLHWIARIAYWIFRAWGLLIQNPLISPSIRIISFST